MFLKKLRKKTNRFEYAIFQCENPNRNCHNFVSHIQFISMLSFNFNQQSESTFRNRLKTCMSEFFFNAYQFADHAT